MPKGGRGRKKSETLEVQYRVKAPGPAGVKPPAAIGAEVFNRWVQTGRVARGFELVVSFRNPDRKDAHKARWKHSTDKGQSLRAIRKTLHLASWAALDVEGAEEE